MDLISSSDSEKTDIETLSLKTRKSSVKNHVCPYSGCEAAFNRPWKLNRHINTHTKQRPFKCDYPGCSKDYTNKSHLDRHKCVSHAKNKLLQVQIPCPYPECSKVFMNKWSVKRHMKTHTKKDSYDCGECGTSFKKYKQLKNHVYVHLGLKPFICDDCNDCFNTPNELKYHKKKHKTYTCEQKDCSETFNTWNALRKHLKVSHFTCKYYVVYNCDSCHKTFRNKWTLTEHVLSHLPHDKREAFTCPHENCKRFYFHQRNLEFHLKSFHQNINYTCEIENCGQTFVKKIDLKKHHNSQHTKATKTSSTKIKKPRKERKDKGLQRRSMAAVLSGIILPSQIEKNLAQNNKTPEVLDCLQQIKNSLLNNVC